MPLSLHKYLKPEGELGMWIIEEDEAYFLERLDFLEVEEAYFNELKGKRRIEWLAARWLLHLMSGREKRGACLKDEYGKPYLEGSFFDISISHSRDRVVVMAAPRLVGIDIQIVVEKIERIAHKFMRTEELESLQADTRLDHLHVYWGAKEALYKAYGRKQLDFRTHIFIDPFSYDLVNGTCTGRVKKDDFEGYFNLWYERMGDYILVYGMEDIGDVRLA